MFAQDGTRRNERGSGNRLEHTDMRTTRSIPISAFAHEEARLNALAAFLKENRCRVIHMLVKSACRKYGIEPMKTALAKTEPKTEGRK